MNNYDFIEIGCSDFNTLIQQDCTDMLGVSIEPIKYYLDRLPNKKNIKKLNWAISDYNGYIKIYYINKENLEKYNFPDWTRGCSSVNKYHPTVLKFMINNNISIDVFSEDIVEVHNINFLFNYLNLKSLKYLKIDCEGHDSVIVNDLLNFCENNITKLPKLLEFENNELSNAEETNNLIFRLKKLNYEEVKIGPSDLQFKLLK